jgi:hypothetical protein
MKLIIYDQLKRHWGSYFSFFLAAFVFGVLVPELRVIPPLSFFVLLVIANIPLSELLGGYARIALSLPLTAQLIGRTFWWLSVGLMSLSLIFFSGLGMVIRSHDLNDLQQNSIVWLHLVIMGSLGFGAVFWLFSGGPRRSSKNWKENLPGQVYGYVSFGTLVGGAYLLYKIHISLELKFIIISSFCGVLTILGWLRAEGLVTDYGEYQYEIPDSDKSNETTKSVTGYGGIPYLITKLGARLFFLGILLMATIVGWSALKGHYFRSTDIPSFAPMLQLYFIFACLSVLSSIMLHLKFLRTLPITSKKLAAVILGLVLTSLLFFGGMILLFMWLKLGEIKALSLFKTYLLGVPPVCVLATAALWLGEKRIIRILTVAVIFIITIIPLIYQLTFGVLNSGKQDLPLWIVIGFPLFSFVAALFAISHLLERNSLIYRIRPDDVNRAMGTNWS